MAPDLRIIVNPASNRGRSGRLLPMVESLLQGRHLRYRVSTTTSLEHAGELAAAAVAAGEVAVAMGGDGVVTAVAAAVVTSDRDDATFSLIPAGTANDFARWVGIRSVRHAVDVLAAGRIDRLDAGLLNGRPFLCIASVGIDTRVIEIASASKRVPSWALYPYATVRALARWRPVRIELELDGVTESFDGYNVVVANTGTYGKGMKMAPDADTKDGLFDVVTIGAVGKLDFLRTAPKIFSGRHVHHPLVTVRRASSVKVRLDGQFDFYADGEKYGPEPAHLEVAPGGLPVFVP